MSSDELNSANNSGNTAGTHCASCGAVMPPDLRFCRNCGARLGEDVAEYTETVRLPGGPTVTAPPQAPATHYGFGSGPQGPQAFGPPGAAQMQWAHKKKRKFSGMTWLFIGLLIFFVGAGIFTALMRPNRPNIAAAARAPRAYVGVDEFDAAPGGGATFDNVEPPGAPADLAGLIGGDVITSFDGHPVKDDDELMDLLGRTTIGKPAEVIFIRDGETKKTMLTPISREELSAMERAFRARPEGHGRFGYETSRTSRVLVPGTTTYGVQLENGSILGSLPADMAGIKDGEIIVEFDGIPIRTPGELEARVRRAKPYEAVTVTVMRDGQKVPISVKMGRQR